MRTVGRLVGWLVACGNDDAPTKANALPVRRPIARVGNATAAWLQTNLLPATHEKLTAPQHLRRREAGGHGSREGQSSRVFGRQQQSGTVARSTAGQVCGAGRLVPKAREAGGGICTPTHTGRCSASRESGRRARSSHPARPLSRCLVHSRLRVGTAGETGQGASRVWPFVCAARAIREMGVTRQGMWHV